MRLVRVEPMTKIFRLLYATPVTSFFALVCIVVYFAMIASGAHFANPHNQALIAWGGNYRPLTVDGQEWRLLSAIFVHGGWLHLCFNMIALFDIGRLLEQKIGKRMQFAIFLLSGLFGGLCSLIWHPDSVGVGASGAIMGLAGALLVWLSLPKLEQAQQFERKLQVVALIIGVTLTLGVGAFSQRIDNAAHAGGLATGLIIGALVYAIDRVQPGAIKRWLAAALMMAAGLLLLAWGVSRQSSDEYKFRKPLAAISQIFDQYSDITQFLRRLPHPNYQTPGPGSPLLPRYQARDQQQEQAYQHAIESWKECLYLSTAWQGLNLSKEQDVLGRQIIAYCDARQRQYQLLWQYQKQQLQGDPAKNQEIGQRVLQANALYLQLLPTLRKELEIDNTIHDQIGMSMRGKKETKESKPKQ